MTAKLRIKDKASFDISLAKKGLNYRKFADDIGISHPYLSQVVNGKRSPSPYTAMKIAKGVGKKTDDIFFILSGNKSETLKVSNDN